MYKRIVSRTCVSGSNKENETALDWIAEKGGKRGIRVNKSSCPNNRIKFNNTDTANLGE